MAKILIADIVAALPLDQRGHLLAATEQKQRRLRSPFKLLYPDTDQTLADGTIIHARHKYAKHMEFFSAGAQYRERCLMAGNRIGKTTVGAYETTCHLTGEYPKWWVGYRFDKPVNWWAAGKTNETTRDIVQAHLLGVVKHEGMRKIVDGSGMVPAHLLGFQTWKQGVNNLVDTVRVKHVSGGESLLGFKAYNQGRGAFEGTAQHGIWADEEMPMDVYGECIIRTATTDGRILLTFTPLEGLSEVALQFMPSDMVPDSIKAQLEQKKDETA